jgi:hypothetical protein
MVIGDGYVWHLRLYYISHEYIDLQRFLRVWGLDKL